MKNTREKSSEKNDGKEGFCVENKAKRLLKTAVNYKKVEIKQNNRKL